MAVWGQNARGLRVLIGTILLAAGGGQGHATALAGTAPPQTAIDVLQQMSGRAAIIFVGQVVKVGPASSAPGVVEVEFQVDTPIRGCGVGSYTLREWERLWAIGSQRFQVGQRRLMLLHGPSAGGLSSPVDGLDGAIPIRLAGAAKPYADTTSSVPIVDLRWLAAKLPRSISYRQTGAAEGGRALPPVPFVATQEMMAQVRSGDIAPAVLVAPASGGTAGGSLAAEQASVDTVVSLLKTWEEARHVAP